MCVHVCDVQRKLLMYLLPLLEETRLHPQLRDSRFYASITMHFKDSQSEEWEFPSISWDQNKPSGRFICHR